MNRRLDPATGDYILEDGAIQTEEDTLGTQVYFCLFTRRGAWPFDENFGSRLHELRARKSPTRAVADLPAMVKEALQPLVTDGRIGRIEVVAEAGVASVTARITLWDTGERPYSFELFQAVGA